MPTFRSRYAGRRLMPGATPKLGYLYVLDEPAGALIARPELGERRELTLGRPFGRPVLGERVELEEVERGRFKQVGVQIGAPADDRVPTWAVEDAAAQVALDAARLERRRGREAKEAVDDLTIAQLRERLGRLPTPQRTAMIAVVLRRLGA
jgi:hypothetical protein